MHFCIVRLWAVLVLLQEIVVGQEDTGRNLTFGGAPSLVFEPTKIGQTPLQDNEKVLDIYPIITSFEKMYAMNDLMASIILKSLVGKVASI
mgnify:CR=1 FL=1